MVSTLLLGAAGHFEVVVILVLALGVAPFSVVVGNEWFHRGGVVPTIENEGFFVRKIDPGCRPGSTNLGLARFGLGLSRPGGNRNSSLRLY